MATIKERAKKWALNNTELGYNQNHQLEYHILVAEYIAIATEQLNVDKWKARKAFCKSTCGDKCPLKANDVEGGGGLVVDCKKLEMFIEAMEE